MRDWAATLRKLDEDIRAGNGAGVRSELGRLARRRVPREHAARVAQLAWRANAPSIGIRVLGPLVRPNRRFPAKPTPEETAEYSQCLILVGAVAEAVELLQKIADPRLPKAWLYEASGHMSQWDYQSAHPLLVKYAKAPGLPVYQRLVGKVNVAACLVALRRGKEATGLLRELLYELSLRRHALLYGNALQISAHNFAQQGKYKDVELCLRHAEPTLVLAGAEPLYVRKWLAIAKLIGNKADAASVTAVRAVRDEAEKAHDWETVRGCDCFQAIYCRDEDLLARIYFGTPYEAFRRRLLADYGTVRLPDEYRWKHGTAKRSEKNLPTMDLVSGEWQGKATALRPGTLLHRLLVILCSDFYRPFRAAALHQGLYPGEIYHPESSPARVYEAMKRLRSMLEEIGIPLKPSWDSGAYRIEARGPCAVRISLRQPLARWDTALDRLKERWKSESFSINEASQYLVMNPRTVLRWCESAREEGTLLRSGKGRSVRYAFLSK